MSNSYSNPTSRVFYRATIHHTHRMQIKTPCGNTAASGCLVLYFGSFYSYSTEHSDLAYYARIGYLCSHTMLSFKHEH